MSHATAGQSVSTSANGSGASSACVAAGARTSPGVDSPVVRAAIEAIVAEVRARSAAITDVRGPVSPQATQDYEALMKRAADVRGRALLYPYLGSGAGNGALVELADGSVKWDMICGIGVQFFGHSDPDLISAALRGATSDTVMQGNLQGNADQYEFAELLVSHARKRSRLAHLYFATNGVMANENALKICCQKAAASNASGSGAPRVLAFRDCFMGRSVTMSQIGDSAANRVGLPLSTLVDYVPFYDPIAADELGQARHIDSILARVQEYIDRYPRQHACFIFELVQGEGGFNTAPREFFVELMRLCRSAGVPVWDDEIQTFGRTTSLFAYESMNLGEYVDVLCVGKLTQVCATLWTPEFNPGPGLLSGTFTGGAVPYAVGKRVVERLAASDSFGDSGRFARHHRAFAEQVQRLAQAHPAWFPRSPRIKDIVGGTGGMMRFSPFGGDKDKIMKACKTIFEEGAIVFYCGHGPYHIRMLPPLPVFDEKDWPRVFACVERGLARVA
ncbi:MAG: aminotransferase class III-fold pyridoxal phosphate-dependent enzyme [Phycisphaerales bacterium]